MVNDQMDHVPIFDTFPGEQLLTCLWYADIANYLAIEQISSHWTPQEKRNFLVEVKRFVIDDPYLFKYYPYQLIR